MDDPRRSFEFRLLDQADKIRIIIVGFFLVVLYTAPPQQGIRTSLAASVMAFAAIYALFARFVVNWQSIRREGQVHLMAGFLVVADVLFMSVFLWAMDGAFTSMSVLLLTDVVFAAAFFTGLELVAVVGIVCNAYVVLAASKPGPDVIWSMMAGVGAIVVVAWLAYALSEVARREQATSDRIVKYLTEGVVLVSDQGVISVVNPRIEQMLGVRSQDLVGANVHDPANAERLAPIAELLADLPGPGQAHRDTKAREIRLEQPQPLVIQCVTVPCMTETGKLAASVVVCKDITDMLLTVRAQEEGLALLSHELRGRVHGLRASAEVLSRMVDVLTPEMRHEMIGILESETRRLTRLIGRLLDASSIEDGSEKFSLDLVSVGQIARDVCRSLERTAQEQGIVLTCEVAPDTPVVQGDTTRLDQVLQNLAENALRFTPAGGQVTVAVAPVEKGARVSVTDTGCGIPPDRAEVIFEKFVHEDEGKRGSVGGGLGLGLHICREIVRRHGGQIGVHSEVGKGSEFFFTLPPAETHRAIGTAPAVTTAEPAGED